MRKNIFVEAKFGDKFITNNGKCSVLLNNSHNEYCLACEDGHLESYYKADGTLPEEYEEYGEEYKIIGKYVENEDIIHQKIKSIVDDYLKDHYGKLDEQAMNHKYTRELVELLMMSAYNAGH